MPRSRTCTKPSSLVRLLPCTLRATSSRVGRIASAGSSLDAAAITRSVPLSYTMGTERAPGIDTRGT